MLVASAFAAFFVAQQLKSSPSVVQSFKVKYPVISPNGDGRLDRQRVTFRLKRADTVDVAVVNDQGDVVRELASGKHLDAYRQLLPSLAWDGTDASGRPAPDGVYRIRITLRGEGRSVIVPRAFRVDRTAPAPRILSIGPDPRARAGAAAAPGRRARTDPPVRAVPLRGAAHLPHVARRAAAADDDRDPRRGDDGELGRHRRQGTSGAAGALPRGGGGARQGRQHRHVRAAHGARPAGPRLRAPAARPRRHHRPPRRRAAPADRGAQRGARPARDRRSRQAVHVDGAAHRRRREPPRDRPARDRAPEAAERARAAYSSTAPGAAPGRAPCRSRSTTVRGTRCWSCCR